jgi:hypothetical protein
MSGHATPINVIGQLLMSYLGESRTYGVTMRKRF